MHHPRLIQCDNGLGPRKTILNRDEDPRGGGPKYKILNITNRYDEHIANFAKDYIKIQELALRDKQFEAIKKWMDEHIEDTYISVNTSNRECDFANNWVKE